MLAKSSASARVSVSRTAIVNYWHTRIAARSRCRVVIIDLHFDPTLGCEFRYDDRVCDLFEKCWVGLSPEPVVKRVKVGSSNDIIEVNRLGYLSTTLYVRLEASTHIIWVKGQRVWCTFGPTPEWLACVRDSILRQAVQQLSDRIAVFLLELQSCPNNAFFKGNRLVRDQIWNDLLYLFRLLTRVFESAFQEVGFR